MIRFLIILVYYVVSYTSFSLCMDISNNIYLSIILLLFILHYFDVISSYLTLKVLSVNERIDIEFLKKINIYPQLQQLIFTSNIKHLTIKDFQYQKKILEKLTYIITVDDMMNLSFINLIIIVIISIIYNPIWGYITFFILNPILRILYYISKFFILKNTKTIPK